MKQYDNNSTISAERLQKNIAIGTINFSSLSDNELIEFIDHTIKNKAKITISHPNAHFVVEAERKLDFRKNINDYTLVQPDGIGIYFASKILFTNSKVFRSRQNGTDFYYRLLDYCDNHGMKLFILGSTDEVLNVFRDYINKTFMKIKIVGFHHGFFNFEDTEVVKNINLSCPDILLIGMGVPRQEQWLQSNITSLSVPISITVGAGIEFISQRKRRAPNMMRKIGIEWLFRLIQEPNRLWKRYIIGIPKFISIILKQKIQQSVNKNTPSAKE